ncbi:hypothetical protein MUK42_30261 [Musa troglodytarum]|uniref:Uncharacterized protein n=1 Tax=Musa troglodytarum TaxID=320322 RepID=A0A9E7FJT3_9LILI|nr:hypothetical protein MUK42_30261 [Musa troglodytarum]URD96397.1 hypothetical protein MUK42_30261 [Musa troglodytarum]
MDFGSGFTIIRVRDKTKLCDSDPHPITRPLGFSEGDERRDEAEPWRAAGEIGAVGQLMLTAVQWGLVVYVHRSIANKFVWQPEPFLQEKGSKLIYAYA